MGRYSNSGVGRRSLNDEKHWKVLDITKTRIRKPTLICLGGNGTTDDTISKEFKDLISGTERANGVCAIAERLIGLKPQEQNVYSTYAYVDFISFYYGKDSVHDKIGKFSEDEVKKIVKYTLIPLCIDKNCKRLPLEEAEKRVSLVTFFTHCHGAIEVANIMRTFSLYLNKIGYSNEEVDKIISNIFQVTYSPLTDEFWTPTIKVDSFMDKFNVGMDDIFEESYGYKLNGIASFIDKKGTMWGKECPWVHCDIISLYTSKLLNNSDLEKSLDEHSIENIDRNKSWNVKSGAKNADVVSKIVGYAIARNIARSLETYETNTLLPKLSMQELKTEIDSLISSCTTEELEG